MTKRIPVINTLIWLSIITSSFDIFLTFDIFGLTIRVSQLIMMLVMVCFLAEFIAGKAELYYPVGFVWLFLCVLLNTLFCFNSQSITNALGYDLWFVFDAVQLVVMTHYLYQTESLESITKKYLYCFMFMAVIGLMQVVLQYVGIYFFVTQQNDMYRANGFSYEPSYYSTYMLIGWCICMYLFEKDDKTVLSRGALAAFTVVITLALILSTSRMGWVMMALYMLFRLAVNFKSLFKGGVTRWKIILIAFIFVLIAAVIFVIYGVITQNETVMKYVDGLGIGGSSDHSSSDRIERLMYTLQVYLNNPVIGVSLGGVDPEICYDILGMDSFTNGTAMTTFAEVLAALGAFGFAFWLAYMYKLFAKHFKTKYDSPSHGNIAAAYVIALAFVLIILQMNQNILRPVLWVHISLLSAIYRIQGKNVKTMCRLPDKKPEGIKEKVLCAVKTACQF